MGSSFARHRKGSGPVRFLFYFGSGKRASNRPRYTRRVAMQDKRFHLGWFTYFGQNAWNDQLGSAPEPWTGELHLDLVRAMERACFDYLLIEDTLSVPSAFKHSMETYLKHGIMVPKHDPVPLTAIL